MKQNRIEVREEIERNRLDFEKKKFNQQFRFDSLI